MKKQVATWIVTGMLAVGGVAFADSHEVEDPSLVDGTTTTTEVEETTTTTVDESTTTTTEVDETTTTTVDESTTTTTEVEELETDADVDTDAHGDEAHGNSAAAHYYDHPGCANHGGYVSLAAKARKAGEEPPTDCTADASAETTTVTRHGKGGGKKG